ncbi:MAG: hypothetical protein ACRC9Z_02320 [Weissella confusa]
MFKLNLFTYLSTKSRLERKRKVIDYRSRKYDDLTADELQLAITELENAQTTSKTYASFFNLAAISSIVGGLIYAFKTFSEYLLIANGVKKVGSLSKEAVQFGRVVDIMVVGIFIIIAILFIVWFNSSRAMRALVIQNLKKRVESGENTDEQ